MATPAELAFQQILFALKIRHQFQREMRRKGGRYAIVDFYLPDYHAIIEIDGGYHNDVIQKHLDKRRTKEILNNNKIPEKVVRFTNKEVLDAPEQAAQRLVKELEGE
jgi:very-short-patch-repair endonuclease